MGSEISKKSGALGLRDVGALCIFELVDEAIIIVSPAAAWSLTSPLYFTFVDIISVFRYHKISTLRKAKTSLWAYYVDKSTDNFVALPFLSRSLLRTRTSCLRTLINVVNDRIFITGNPGANV